jgi:hypothetical protein
MTLGAAVRGLVLGGLWVVLVAGTFLVIDLYT